MVVTIFGLGFVGLTTALGLAEMGHRVYGIEIDQEKKSMIVTGKIPFLEPGLEAALERHLDKRFWVVDNVKQAIAESEIIYYCVGTPYGENGQADLTYLFQAIDQTLENIEDKKFRVMVIKSTVPPSTTAEKIIPYLTHKGINITEEIGVANNPEFLREGHCWEDFIHADRIVLGTNDERSEKMLRKLYETVNSPIFCVSLNTAEYIKYLSNTLLATMISYANEMSIVADKIGGIDVASAFHILHMDKRWGNCAMTSYVHPGCGYGGYCLPKDTNALYALAHHLGYRAQILENVIKVNDDMPKLMVERIKKALNDNKPSAIGILGLSFKPDSDDVRDTPSAKIIKQLIAEGYGKIYAYDPVAMKEFEKQYQLDVTYASTYLDVIKCADVIVILTAWKEFRDIRLHTDKPIVDCRYML